MEFFLLYALALSFISTTSGQFESVTEIASFEMKLDENCQATLENNLGFIKTVLYSPFRENTPGLCKQCNATGADTFMMVDEQVFTGRTNDGCLIEVVNITFEAINLECKCGFENKETDKTTHGKVNGSWSNPELRLTLKFCDDDRDKLVACNLNFLCSSQPCQIPKSQLKVNCIGDDEYVELCEKASEGHFENLMLSAAQNSLPAMIVKETNKLKNVAKRLNCYESEESEDTE